MSIEIPTQEHEAFYQDLAAILRKHAGHLTSVELLAVAAGMVGKIIALQDQRTMTVAQAMKIVDANIVLGNQHIISDLKLKTEGNA